MHRALFAVALLGLVAPASAGAPPAPPRARTFVLGNDLIPSQDPFWRAAGDGDSVSTLAEIDPSSLRPVGRPLRLADLSSDEPLISPDRRVIAAGSNARGRIIRVDPVRWRRLAPFQVGEPWDEENGDGARVDLLSWPGPLIATTGPPEGKQPRDRTLLVVDATSGRITASEPLGGFELGSAVAPDGGVVVLSAPADRIGVARLTTVAPSGTIRSVTLDRIPGGWTGAAEAVPGLAVDFAAGRAVVVARDVAAEVDTASLAVAYHPLPTGGTAPAGPPHRTGTVGPQDGFQRRVRQLDNGWIAVSGVDEAIAGAKQADRPAGLRIINPATWTANLADPGVSWFEFAGHTLLASTVAWDSSRHEWAGYWLAAFGPEGERLYRRRPFHGRKGVLDGPSWGTDGEYLYWWGKPPWVDTDQRRTLRDPRTGTVVRRVVRYIGDYSSDPFTWTPPD